MGNKICKYLASRSAGVAERVVEFSKEEAEEEKETAAGGAESIESTPEATEAEIKVLPETSAVATVPASSAKVSLVTSAAVEKK